MCHAVPSLPSCHLRNPHTGVRKNQGLQGPRNPGGLGQVGRWVQGARRPLFSVDVLTPDRGLTPNLSASAAAQKQLPKVPVKLPKILKPLPCSSPQPANPDGARKPTSRTPSSPEPSNLTKLSTLQEDVVTRVHLSWTHSHLLTKAPLPHRNILEAPGRC